MANASLLVLAVYYIEKYFTSFKLYIITGGTEILGLDAILPLYRVLKN